MIAQLFHCFEVVTKDNYFIWADLNEESMKLQLKSLLIELGNEVETIAVGCCEAKSIHGCHYKIRGGEWSYTLEGNYC